jgi:hypothetical protein
MTNEIEVPTAPALHQPRFIELLAIMRFLLAIFLSLIMWPAQSQVPISQPPQIKIEQKSEEAPKSKKEENGGKGIAHNPILCSPKLICASPTKHEQYSEEVSKEGTEFWPPFFGYRLKVTDTFIVFFTALLFFATRALVTEGKNTSQKQLRAYVHLACTNIRLTVDKNKIITNCAVEIKWENAGLTPALSSVSWSGFCLNPVDKPFEMPFEKKEVTNIRTTVGPKGKIDSAPINISANNLANIFDWKAHALIWGRIEYRDVFSKEIYPPKHTEICLEVVVETDPRLAVDPAYPFGIRFQGVQEHNSTS